MNLFDVVKSLDTLDSEGLAGRDRRDPENSVGERETAVGVTRIVQVALLLDMIWARGMGGTSTTMTVEEKTSYKVIKVKKL